MATPGRNDPCPCGSGKKYKKCCLRRAASPAVVDAQAAAVERALGFLGTRYRRAAEAALDSFPGDEDGPFELPELAPEIEEMLETARLEWLLAEAKLEVRGRLASAWELLTGPGGPPLPVAEREALRELAERPRRLYEVTAVRAGESVTVEDVVDGGAEPVVVRERTGSRTLSAGDVVAWRLVRRSGDGAWVVSGPVYPLPRGFLQPLREEIREIEAECDPEESRLEVSDLLTAAWIQVVTMGLPKMVHAVSGETILLTSDHYRVGDRLEVFSPTRGLADETRAWLEAIAGGAVELRARQHVDPASDAAQAAAAKRRAGPVEGTVEGAVEVPPELRQQSIEELYADWPDVPIPALHDETPRQAMATALGRERLTELLLEYEHSERELAGWEGRQPVSFDFLWRRVGLEPARR